MKRNSSNYWIYLGMISVFGVLIYLALCSGERFDHHPGTGIMPTSAGAFELFTNIISDNMTNSLTILLLQIIVILLTVRVFSYLFKYIGQPGVMGEIVAGIVLGPSLLGYFFPEFSANLFPPESLDNLNLLSQIGLVLFMFVIGLELDFSVLKNKLNETLVISHAGIVVPFFLGVVAAIWVYEDYASGQTAFLPFALFIGICMSITAFPVLARIVQERNMTKTSVGMLSIASAANDDVTAWCLLAIVIALAKAGTFVSALYTIGLTLIYIVFMFLVMRPFLRKIGETYAYSEVINKTFVGFIFLILVLSSAITEIIGIHALFGAFIAGVVMPTNIGFRKVMMEKVEDVSLVFFLPLFFAFSGLHTEIGLINTPELWGVCLLFIVVAIAGKFGGCTLAARAVGENWKDSLIVGTLMNTRGLMQLVALNIGFEMGILTSEMFVVLLLISLLTTFMATPMLSLVERIFSKQKESKGHREKVLLSFGRPETGKTLLNIADLMLGHRLQSSLITGIHFTLGTDLNPAKADEYEQESFIPLREEAEHLQLHVQERYQVTDRLIPEMVKIARQEQVDHLFLGAGQQFMMGNDVPAGTFGKKFTTVSRWLKQLKNHPLHLPGTLLRQKLESIMEHVDCSVGIFVNRGFTHASYILLLVDNETDLFLFNYAQTRLGEQSMTIRICFTDEHPNETVLARVTSDFVQRDTAKFILDTPLVTNPLAEDKESLLVLSYATCQKLSKDQNLFAKLPSLLIIRPQINTENTNK
ncbi:MULTISPECIES: cation:proton antiporter domain-containing protein [Butyricimonas]|uniref:cation:proton antiporter domain-containing protein n=1 Tax=Butyricimonas TaxID=574697 RepID=UPI001D06E63C|nr:MULTISPECIES: cation:proton antiporter [Butyricimonas]MCB6971904.1 cation:proton antiporter [Butyricimonas synergistica]MCG4518912.1 cation:proton antiporter [Butyricimonas sp. DFI.6.44]